jgi:hypothetical protein
VAEDRWSAYLDAVVEIDLPDGRVRVEPAEEGAVGVFPLGNDIVHVLTAFVSAERRSPENELRQQPLLDELGARDLTLLPALGGDSHGAHTEESVAVIGRLTDYEALAVGKSYAQDAIFRWTASEFALVACADGQTWHRGWQFGTHRFRPH